MSISAKRLAIHESTIAVLLGCTLLGACGVSKNSKYWQAVRGYQAGSPIEPQQLPGGRRHWSLEHQLPDGVKVSIKAEDGPFPNSDITVKYSDEAQGRVVYDYVDYVYPARIRVEGNVMYAVISGLAGGFWGRTRLIVYDLSARKKLREMNVNPADVGMN